MLTVLHSDFYLFQSQTAKHLKANSGKKHLKLLQPLKFIKDLIILMNFGIIFQQVKKTKEKNWDTLKLSTLTTYAY